MQVLHLTPTYNFLYGGTERYCFYLTRALARMGHDVTVYSLSPNGKTHEVELNGVHVVYIKGTKPIYRVNPFFFVLNRLRKEKYDIVHVHSYVYFHSNQAALARYMFGHDYILHIHGGLTPITFENFRVRALIKKFYDATVGRFTIKASPYYMTVCENDKLLLSQKYRINPKRIVNVGNGVDISKFRPTKREKGRFIFIGDLERWKGIQDLIVAFSRLKYHLTVYGGGTLEPLLRRVPSNIEYMGEAPHDVIAKELPRHQALILPTYMEGMPNVVLEALASGVPVIATPVGGIPEVVIDGMNGVHIRQPGKPTYIIEAVNRFVSIDDVEENTLGKNARKMAEQFSWKKIATRVSHVYEYIASHRRRA